MLKSINITAVMGFLDLNIGTVKYVQPFKARCLTCLASLKLGAIVFSKIMNLNTPLNEEITAFFTTIYQKIVAF